jgi:hypothetical protein
MGIRKARRRMTEERVKAFEDAVSKSNSAYYESLLKAIRNASTELVALRSFVEEHYADLSEDDRPTFRRTAAALTYCENLAVEFLKKTGGGEPPAVPDSTEAPEIDKIQVAEGNRVSAKSDPDVVQLLEEALGYLRLQQRHNQAVFLVEEAIRWTKMSIASWYLEVTQDANMSGFISALMRRYGSPTG